MEKLNEYLPLVEQVAQEPQNQGLTLEELIEAGNDGLRKAGEKFVPKADFSFESYAVWWIRQRIIQAIAERSHYDNNHE